MNGNGNLQVGILASGSTFDEQHEEKARPARHPGKPEGGCSRHLPGGVHRAWGCHNRRPRSRTPCCTTCSQVRRGGGGW